jgi:hypothetical protein
VVRRFIECLSDDGHESTFDPYVVSGFSRTVGSVRLQPDRGRSA